MKVLLWLKFRKLKVGGNLKSEREERVDAENESIAVLTDVGGNLKARHSDHHLEGVISVISCSLKHRILIAWSKSFLKSNSRPGKEIWRVGSQCTQSKYPR